MAEPTEALAKELAGVKPSSRPPRAGRVDGTLGIAWSMLWRNGEADGDDRRHEAAARCSGSWWWVQPPALPNRPPTRDREHQEMTEQEEQELYRKIDRLQTDVHLLGSMAGIMLALLGQLGWRQVEQAIIQGLTDAAASVPARSEADWDSFMAYIRQQGAAVTVTKTRTTTSSIPLQPIRPAPRP